MVSFYLGWVVDLRDRRIDLGEVVTQKPSQIVLSTVGFSLYCLEFSLIFGLKYFWESYLKRGYAILKVGLKYVKEENDTSGGSLGFYASTPSGIFP